MPQAKVTSFVVEVRHDDVKTDYDVLAGQQPVAHPGDDVFVFVTIKNVGSYGTCFIRVKVDETLLWEYSSIELGEGEECVSLCLIPGGKYPFTMPKNDVEVTVTVGHT